MSALRQRAVVIGSSAGGIGALKRLVAALPAEFPAPVFIVQHVAPQYPSFLPEILTAAGKIPARHPDDGETIKAPHIYVAPPDHHLLIEGTRVAVKRGPKENRFRPSADALFRSAAYTYREAAIGVVLTGALTDGTSGLWTIKRLGGTTIVQDPSDALVPSMPMSALRDVEIDYSLPLAKIPEVLMAKIEEPLAPAPKPSDDELRRVKIEQAIAGGALPLEQGVFELGPPSRYSCPECHGVLGHIVEGPITRFRCHTGHAYTEEAFLAGAHHASDEALAESITRMEESVMLLEEIGARHRSQGNDTAAEEYFHQAGHARRLMDILRDVVQENRAGYAKRA
jgi:two-component system chemotaxis response regulator CheB